MAELFDTDTGACRVCGCTDNTACPGGCCWVPDPLTRGELCSACAIRPCVGGLDLSITATGVAHWADIRTETWTTNDGDGDARLNDLAARLILYIDGFPCRPELLVIEDLLFGPRASKSSGITSMLHGVVRCELIERSVPYLLVSPSTLKIYATGNGQATKGDMRAELIKRAGLDVRSEDECDSWWLRALGLDLLGEPLLDLPKTHRRALDKLTLPKPVAA